MEWITTPTYCYFLTFTYSEEDLPAHGSLQKKKFLKWINNAQKTIGPFRYYAIGEYGNDTYRPHYHVAIFPTDNAQPNALRGLWSKGFTSATELNHARARYLANYTAKKLTKSTDERLQLHQEPEFRTSSRRPPLGSAFVDILHAHWTGPRARKIIEKHGDVTRTFRIDGRIYPLGQWVLTTLRKKLGIPLLHRDRIKANPNYLQHFEHEDTEWISDEYSAMLDKQIQNKMNQGRYRGKGKKI